MSLTGCSEHCKGLSKVREKKSFRERVVRFMQDGMTGVRLVIGKPLTGKASRDKHQVHSTLFSGHIIFVFKELKMSRVRPAYTIWPGPCSRPSGQMPGTLPPHPGSTAFVLCPSLSGPKTWPIGTAIRTGRLFFQSAKKFGLKAATIGNLHDVSDVGQIGFDQHRAVGRDGHVPAGRA